MGRDYGKARYNKKEIKARIAKIKESLNVVRSDDVKRSKIDNKANISDILVERINPREKVVNVVSEYNSVEYKPEEPVVVEVTPDSVVDVVAVNDIITEVPAAPVIIETVEDAVVDDHHKEEQDEEETAEEEHGQRRRGRKRKVRIDQAEDKTKVFGSFNPKDPIAMSYSQDAKKATYVNVDGVNPTTTPIAPNNSGFNSNNGGF